MSQRFRLFAGCCLIVGANVGFEGFGQTPGDLGPGVIFQNTTASPLDLYRVSPDGAEERVVEQLAPGAESARQPTSEGDAWRVKLHDDRQVDPWAEYTTSSAADQIVDLADLIAWQTPVKLVIQNNGESPIAVASVNEDGEETVHVAELPSGSQVTVTAYPGSGWRLRDADEIIAEYSAGIQAVQQLDVTVLKAAYANGVLVSFQNTTGDTVDIYWVHPDGHEVECAKGLPSGRQFEQQGHPGQLWSVRREGEIVAYYRFNDRKEQIVDLAELAKDTQAVLDEIAANAKLCQVVTKPSQSPVLAVRGANDPTAQAATTLSAFLPSPEQPKRTGRNAGAGGIAYAPLSGANGGEKLVDLSKLTATSGNPTDTGVSQPKPGLPKPRTNLPKPKQRSGNSN